MVSSIYGIGVHALGGVDKGGMLEYDRKLMATALRAGARNMFVNNILFSLDPNEL
jgi:hypothetical protein